MVVACALSHVQRQGRVDAAGRVWTGAGRRISAAAGVGRTSGHWQAEERRKAVDFSSPYYDVRQAVVALKSSPAARPIAASEKGGLLNAPDTYFEKLAVGPVVAGKVDIRRVGPAVHTAALSISRALSARFP